MYAIFIDGGRQYKFRRRKNFRKRTGHRQLYTRVRISKIEGI